MKLLHWKRTTCRGQRRWDLHVLPSFASGNALRAETWRNRLSMRASTRSVQGENQKEMTNKVNEQLGNFRVSILRSFIFLSFILISGN